MQRALSGEKTPQRARVQAHIVGCASLKPNMLHCCPIDIQEAL